MRDTAASWLVQDGVPLYDVQDLLGHEGIRPGPAAPGTGPACRRSPRRSGMRTSAARSRQGGRVMGVGAVAHAPTTAYGMGTLSPAKASLS